MSGPVLTGAGFVDVDVVDLGTVGAFVFGVYLHYLDFLHQVGFQLRLVLLHQVSPDLQFPHCLRFLHPDHHVVQVEERLLYCLQCLVDVAVLFPVQVEGILGIVVFLEFIGWMRGEVPRSEAMSWRRSPPSVTILSKR